MKIPCKECILLAICRCKEEIKCDKFYDYSVDISPRYTNDILINPLTIDDYWTHLRTILPQISRVVPERLFK